MAIKKVMFLPLNYGDVVQSGVYDAFRQCGCDLKVYDYFYLYETHARRDIKLLRKDFVNSALAYKPDLIHVQVQHTQLINGMCFAEIKKILPNVIITNWTGDVRNYVPSTFIDIARFATYNLISSTGQLKMFQKEIKKEIKYWQIGFNPKLYSPPTYTKNKFEYDISFVGNNNVLEGYPGRGDREQACRLLKKEFGLKFGLYGSLWPGDLASKGTIDQKKVSNVYHNSLCVLSVSHYNDLSHYFSDRLLMCMASGRPTISLKFPKWETYFTNMCDLIIVDSINEIPAKVKMLKNNLALANYIGKSGAEKVYAEHSYYSRIRELLDMINH